MTRRARWWLVLASLLCASASWASCSRGGPASTPGQGRSAPTTSATTIASPAVPAPNPQHPPTTFAVIGDYGSGDAHERAVANLVASWNPTFVITTGDDYYSSAAGIGTGKYDRSTGAFYGKWLKDISTAGRRYPVGTAKVNAFFPALGNHDYSDAAPSPQTYLTYFRLPGSGFTNTSGNERYYDFVEGPVHFFVLNSNGAEPDGTTSSSKQGRWLEHELATSTSRFNVVYDHHPPYSSDSVHGSTTSMRWPFAKWGADAVLSGHAHVYERVIRDRIVYFVNGLGGAARYAFSAPIAGSTFRYRGNWGAQKVTITDTALVFEFYDISGRKIDRYELGTH